MDNILKLDLTKLSTATLIAIRNEQNIALDLDYQLEMEKINEELLRRYEAEERQCLEDYPEHNPNDDIQEPYH